MSTKDVHENHEPAPPLGLGSSEGLGLAPEAAKVTRSFGLRLADEGHPTTVEVAEYSDGSVTFMLITKRAGMEPLQTAINMSPKTFLLLATALNKAAHDPSSWHAA